MPKSLMLSRLPIMLMPYLILYRLSKWFNLAQGKLSQQMQYLSSPFNFPSQFLIGHEIRVFVLRLSSPLQPGHGFLSLANARQRRQFIPQGAISVAGGVVVFCKPFDINPYTSRKPTPMASVFKPNGMVEGREWKERPPRTACVRPARA